jgi:hypothetical protein
MLYFSDRVGMGVWLLDQKVNSTLKLRKREHNRQKTGNKGIVQRK